MPAETVKSNSIGHLDASPPTRDTSGSYAFGRRMELRDYCVGTNSKTSPSFYLLARVPSNCRDVQIILESHGTITTWTGDVGAYYSDNAAECVGRAVGLQGTVIDADFFGSAVAMATADTPTDVTVEAGTYTVDLRHKELWDALGLSADPQCPIDIVFTTTANNNLTTGALLAAKVSFVPAFLS